MYKYRHGCQSVWSALPEPPLCNNAKSAASCCQSRVRFTLVEKLLQCHKNNINDSSFSQTIIRLQVSFRLKLKRIQMPDITWQVVFDTYNHWQNDVLRGYYHVQPLLWKVIWWSSCKCVTGRCHRLAGKSISRCWRDYFRLWDWYSPDSYASSQTRASTFRPVSCNLNLFTSQVRRDRFIKFLAD